MDRNKSKIQNREKFLEITIDISRKLIFMPEIVEEQFSKYSVLKFSIAKIRIFTARGK